MSVKNFDFGARRATAAKAKGRKPKDHPFTLEEGGPTYHARAEMDDESLAFVSGMFFRAERDEDLAGMFESLVDIINNLFTPDTAKALQKRVKDPADPLKINDLTEVIEWAMGLHTGGRPTTSPRT